MGDELTRPVLPQGAAIDYVPSQFLCEFIKKCGYDGVVYRSAVGDGINLALFKPEIATSSKQLTEYVVERVAVEIRWTEDIHLLLRTFSVRPRKQNDTRLGVL